MIPVLGKDLLDWVLFLWTLGSPCLYIVHPCTLVNQSTILPSHIFSHGITSLGSEPWPCSNLSNPLIGTSTQVPLPTWPPVLTPSLTLLPRGILLLLQLLSVTVPYFPLHPLAPQSFILLYVLIMFWFLLNLLRIWFLYASLPLITIVLLSLTPLVVLWRIFCLRTWSSGAIAPDRCTLFAFQLRIPWLLPRVFTLAPSSRPSWARGPLHACVV